MKILHGASFLAIVVGLALYLTPSVFAAKDTHKPLQGYIRKKAKYKMRKPSAKKIDNAYSLSKPYNPNNPPPLDNKIHPVSSNAR